MASEVELSDNCAMICECSRHDDATALLFLANEIGETARVADSFSDGQLEVGGTCDAY
ncbi:MAG TPA: hypothetical protein VK660_01805 [Xanthomonadaceae bacterium]|nr:hypothetical protein [Xanthomonadaceae bacterium]